MLRLASQVAFRAGLGRAAPRARLAPWVPNKFEGVDPKPALVVLDKDGTLLEFDHMWTGWLSANVHNVVQELRLRNGTAVEAEQLLKQETNKALAGCATGTVKGHSPMAHFALSSLRGIAARTLADPEKLGDHAVTLEAAETAVNKVWVDKVDQDELAIPIEGCVQWCKDMAEHGAMLTVCTSDSRNHAEEGLVKVGLGEVLPAERMLCGNDDDYLAKPNPENIAVLQRRTGILDPSRVMVAGDSVLDMGMATGSNAGKSVGVLTGTSTKTELDVAAKEATTATKVEVNDRLGQTYFRPDHAVPHSDFLVIGGGSAGCVTAARLAERNPDATVTLIEAGGPDRGKWDSWHVHMPSALTYNIGHPNYDWMYRTEPLPHLNNRRLAWPRGKVLGGSSSLNAMVYVRGHPLDFERWAEEGADGWGWDEVLPYFRKAEK